MLNSPDVMSDLLHVSVCVREILRLLVVTRHFSTRGKPRFRGKMPPKYVMISLHLNAFLIIPSLCLAHTWRPVLLLGQMPAPRNRRLARVTA